MLQTRSLVSEAFWRTGSGPDRLGSWTPFPEELELWARCTVDCPLGSSEDAGGAAVVGGRRMHVGVRGTSSGESAEKRASEALAAV